MAGEISEQQSAAASTKFPRDKSQYVVIAATPTPDSATTYKGRHVNPTTGEEVPVGIKIFNTYKIEDIYSFTTQLHEAETLDHENLIRVHCSFTTNDQLWMIMSPPGVSIRSIIRSSFQQGLRENIVAFILKETLKGLHYMHGKNKLHENISAARIFLDDNIRVKIAYSSITYDEHRSNQSNDVVPIAPELMKDCGRGNSKASDIWMFGLLALELFYGKIPASDFDEFQLLVNEIVNDLAISEKQENRNQGLSVLENLRCFSCFRIEKKKKKKKIPKPLGEVMAACLSRDPERRPTTNHLMEYKLFQKTFEGDRSLAKVMKKASKKG